MVWSLLACAAGPFTVELSPTPAGGCSDRGVGLGLVDAVSPGMDLLGTDAQGRLTVMARDRVGVYENGTWSFTPLEGRAVGLLAGAPVWDEAGKRLHIGGEARALNGDGGAFPLPPRLALGAEGILNDRAWTWGAGRWSSESPPGNGTPVAGTLSPLTWVLEEEGALKVVVREGESWRWLSTLAGPLLTRQPGAVRLRWLEPGRALLAARDGDALRTWAWDGAAWGELPALEARGPASSPGIDIEADTLAWTDEGTVRVAVAKAGAWQELATLGRGAASLVDLEIVDGRPVVLWAEFAGRESALRLHSWDGAAWRSMPACAPLEDKGERALQELAVADDGRAALTWFAGEALHVLWGDKEMPTVPHARPQALELRGGDPLVLVADEEAWKWTGHAWATTAPKDSRPPAPAGACGAPRNAQATPDLLMWRSTEGKLALCRRQRREWEELPPLEVDLAGLGESTVGLDSEGDPLVALQLGEGVQIYEIEGEKWVRLETPPLASGTAWRLRLASGAGRTCLAWLDFGAGVEPGLACRRD